MAMATQVAGERTATLTKRAMAMKTREVGEEEGNGKKGSNDAYESMVWPWQPQPHNS